MQKFIDIVKASVDLTINNIMIGIPVAVVMLANFLLSMPSDAAMTSVFSIILSIITVAAVFVSLISVNDLKASGKFDHMASINKVISKIVPLVLLYLTWAVIVLVIGAAAFLLGSVLGPVLPSAAVIVYVAAALVWLFVIYAYLSLSDIIILFEGKGVLKALSRNFELIKASRFLVLFYIGLAIIVSWVAGIISGVFGGGVLTAIVSYALNVVVITWVGIVLRYLVYKEAVKLAGK